MTLFDIIALLLLGISSLVGLMRGAMREVTTVAAFVLAVFVSVFALRFTEPMALAAVHPSWAANIVAVLVVFIGAYIVFRVIGGGLTRSVQHTESLGVIDRIIGLGFGLLRGMVLLGVINLLLSAAVPAKSTPDWIGTAKLYPLSKVCGDALRALAPKGATAAGAGKTLSAEKSTEPAGAGAGQSGDSVESAAARKAMNDLVAEKTH